MTIETRLRVRRGDFTLDVDLNIPATGCTGVFGPSGSGKTTLLRAIAGLDRHPDSFIRFDSAVWQDKKQFLPVYERSLGYVFQEASLFPHLSVRGNLDYGQKRAPSSDRRIPVDHAVELLGIGPLLNRRPSGLSGGERQRVAIARALAAGPRLLLMDEPLASLDLRRKREIIPYLESLQRELEIPVIYVSHSLDEVTRLADHLVLLRDGRSTATGPIQQILTRLDLPPAHEPDAISVLEATVAEHDDHYHLTTLDSEAGRITVARHNLDIGASVRLRIAARDVSLTLEHQTGTSILNILPATVVDLVEEESGRIMVQLKAGRYPLLARVTRKSAESLSLEPGKKVFAQVKSVAVY